MTNPAAPEPAPTEPTLLERWRATEPVRLALYPVLVALGGVFLVYGWVSEQQLVEWLALGGAILTAGSVATELARRGAWAPATVRVVADDHAERAADRAFAEGFELGRHEVLVQLDEPGQHAVDREPRTAAIRAQDRGRPPST